MRCTTETSLDKMPSLLLKVFRFCNHLCKQDFDDVLFWCYQFWFILLSSFSFRNNLHVLWIPCTALVLILCAALFQMNIRKLVWSSRHLYCISWGVMVFWKVSVSAEKDSQTGCPSRNSDRGECTMDERVPWNQFPRLLASTHISVLF